MSVTGQIPITSLYSVLEHLSHKIIIFYKSYQSWYYLRYVLIFWTMQGEYKVESY